MLLGFTAILIAVVNLYTPAIVVEARVAGRSGSPSWPDAFVLADITLGGLPM